MNEACLLMNEGAKANDFSNCAPRASFIAAVIPFYVDKPTRFQPGLIFKNALPT